MLGVIVVRVDQDLALEGLDRKIQELLKRTK
jgi:hypothetical protein